MCIVTLGRLQTSLGLRFLKCKMACSFLSSVDEIWYNMICDVIWYMLGFPGGTVGKNLPASAGDEGSIPGSGRSSRGGNGNPLKHSCLENPKDRGAWWATVYGVTKSSTRLSAHTHGICYMIYEMIYDKVYFSTRVLACYNYSVNGQS